MSGKSKEDREYEDAIKEAKERLRKNVIDRMNNPTYHSPDYLSVVLTADASMRMERSSKKLERATTWLVTLTILLVFYTALLLVLTFNI
ncbi:MAG: hypothetical protein V3U49_01310 [Nitrososphaerales archaeon]